MKATILLLLFHVIPTRALAQAPSEHPLNQVTQAITVRLLNAKNGKPMKNKMVTFEWDDAFDKSEIAVNDHGLGMVEVSPGAHKFSLMAGPKVGKDPYRIPYLDCSEGGLMFIQVSLVLEQGYVPPNTCGRQSAVSRPGEVVFWALPNPWWKPDMQ